MLKAYDETTGKEIKKGDMITDFRGEKHIFQMASRARSEGKSGKICTTDHREYYDRVFNIIVKDE